MLQGILLSMLGAVAAPDSPFELLPRAEEVALARSAGLAPWTEEATVYVLESNGYVEAVEGTNGFTCLVGRDHPGTLWPICFDAEGSRAMVPRILREVALRQKGKSEDEVKRDSAERFLSGEYEAPRVPGLAYMLSPEAITFNGRDLIRTPPHLMVYAPNVTGDELGAVPNHPHSPLVLYPGDPHAYIVVFVPDTMPPLVPVVKP